MKKFIFSLTAIVFLSLSACDTSLDETPYSVLSPGNFYSSVDDAIAATLATYSSIAAGGGGSIYGQQIPIYINGFSDEQQGGGPWSTPALYAFDATYAPIQGMWQQMYRAVNFCNAAIDNIPGISMDEEFKNSLIGEARFVRALMYFNLVRMFGPVPLELTESVDLSDAFGPRESKEAIYQSIIEDLQFAENNITQTSTSRATSGAAKGLLAKVYLTMAGVEGPNAGENAYYTLARDKALEVMGMSYFLQEDYDQVFSVDNEGNSEVIFELQHDRGIDGQGSRLAQLSGGGVFFQGPLYHPTLGIKHGFNQGWGVINVSQKWCRETDSDDYRKITSAVCEYERFDGTMISVENRAPGMPIIKWQDDLATGFDAHDNNHILLRYADILLIYAEAENEINPLSADAYAALEQVRKRARDADGVNITGVPIDLTGTLGSKEEFRQAIIDERQIELAFEFGERWFDLKRHGLIQQEITEAVLQPITYFTGMEYLPIPNQERVLNPNLTQNTGW